MPRAVPALDLRDQHDRLTNSLGSKGGREAMAKRFKDPDDPLKLVIVRDMWLTGFDVPPLHTSPCRGTP
jgi:type I site-specific restriction-modification system R (restriction) subunit